MMKDKLQKIIGLLPILLVFTACGFGDVSGEQKISVTQTTLGNHSNSTTQTTPVVPSKGQMVNVSTQREFLNAINNSNVSVINLNADISTPQPRKDDSLVLGNSSSPLTINGNGKTLTISDAGIVLGGDLQFLNVTISFRSPVRNAIIANGYKLTLNSVKKAVSTSDRSIHLFCGGIPNYVGTNSHIPKSGSHGQIIIKGSGNQLGNIYAGSLDDAATEANAQANIWNMPSTITWEVGARGSIGRIYAHGARESRGIGEGDTLYSDSNLYKCNGEVSINFSSGATSSIIIDGRTGGTKNALIQYTDDGNGYQNSPLLKDIGGLKLIAGAGKANLKLQQGSSFQESANIDIPVKTELHLTNLRIPPNTKSLNGGGILILGENQRLTISGAVAGTTRLAISDLTYNDTNSTKIPQTNHTYISAPKSLADSFVLLPPLADEGMKISKDNQGAWTVRNH